MDDKLFVKLRDCFTAGYTLPQYCIDNEIKKPLFVSEKKFLNFVWEIYAQFRYDKRMLAQFSFLDMPSGEINLSIYGTLTSLIFYNISEVNVNNFDKIFLLTSEKLTSHMEKSIYLSELTDSFARKIYAEIPLIHFLQRNPKVKLFMTKLPNHIEKYEGGNEFGNTLIATHLLSKKIIKNVGKPLETPLDKFGYTNQEVNKMIHVAINGIKTDANGLTTMNDCSDSLIQIKNGKRVTAYQPEKFLNKIYFVGPCYYMGSYAPFHKTIESYLQKMLNESNLPYRVENEAQTYWGRYQDMLYNLNALQLQPNDIIFIYVDNLSVDVLPLFDLSAAFDSPNDYREIFVDRSHINEIGYKILAEKYFKFLTENNFFRKVEFNYPIPPPFIIDMVYLLGSSRAA